MTLFIFNLPPLKACSKGPRITVCHWLIAEFVLGYLVAKSCPTLGDLVDCSPPAHLAVGFPWQDYWTGLPFPSPLELNSSVPKTVPDTKQVLSNIYCTNTELLSVSIDHCIYLLLLTLLDSSLWGSKRWLPTHKPESNNGWVGGLMQRQEYTEGFPGQNSGEEPPANAGDIWDAGLIPGSERSVREENGNPLQYSCLEIPSAEETGGQHFMGLQRVRVTKT